MMVVAIQLNEVKIQLVFVGPEHKFECGVTGYWHNQLVPNPQLNYMFLCAWI